MHDDNRNGGEARGVTALEATLSYTIMDTLVVINTLEYYAYYAYNIIIISRIRIFFHFQFCSRFAALTYLHRTDAPWHVARLIALPAPTRNRRRPPPQGRCRSARPDGTKGARIAASFSSRGSKFLPYARRPPSSALSPPRPLQRGVRLERRLTGRSLPRGRCCYRCCYRLCFRCCWRRRRRRRIPPPPPRRPRPPRARTRSTTGCAGST